MINDRLSKRLQVAPLNEGETVTYVVRGYGEIMPSVEDDHGNKKRATPGLVLDGECNITDPFSNNPTQSVHLVHALEYRTVTLPDQTTQQVPIKSRIDMLDGHITVTASDYETYCFLERCNANGSNKFRNKQKRIKFYRKDASKVKLDKAKHYDRIDTAITILRDATKEDVINIAHQINKTQGMSKVNVDQELMLLRGEIRDNIEKYPEIVIMASSDTSNKKKIQAQLAEELFVIDFDEALRDWYFGDEVIANAPIGEDRYDALVAAFEDEKTGAALYKKVMAKYKIKKQ